MKIPEEEFKQLLMHIRFPQGLRCPRCPNLDKIIYPLKDEQYKCKSCKTRFRVFTDTRFEKARMSIPQFYQIVLYFVNGDAPVHEKGVRTEILDGIETTSKSFYNKLNLIRTSLLNELAEDERQIILGDKTIVFGVIEGESVKVVPLPQITGKALKRYLDGFENETLKTYSGLITKHGCFVNEKRATDEESKLVIKPSTPFLGFYETHYYDTISRARSKNFSLFIKGVEYLYNRRDEKQEDVILDILKRLLR